MLRLIKRLARLDHGGCGKADRTALNTRLNESTAHRVGYIRLKASWRWPGRLKELAGVVRPSSVHPPNEL
jgi:hypothetical protein